MTIELALVAIGAAALAAWLVVLLSPPRPWDLHPVAEKEPAPRAPGAWPSVRVLVPARDEAAYLPRTLPALAGQDYPGDWAIVLVDDRSKDGTGSIARSLADGRMTVIDGAPLPAGWTGKVWALQQALAAAGSPDYLLLTDADIQHAHDSLRRLVAESEANGLALNSRMALLRVVTLPERLLIPPFLFFFNLLYPMRLVNDSRRASAAAAGGCVLTRRRALESAGGFTAIRGELIDDVNLALRVKRSGETIRLSVSRASVISLREYATLRSIWRMVRRTAFDELGYSWWRLAGTVVGMGLLFLVPPGLFFLAATGFGTGAWHIAIGALGAAAWLTMAGVFLPTIRHFGLGRAWALTLPFSGLVYGAITVDSARLHALRRDRVW